MKVFLRNLNLARQVADTCRLKREHGFPPEGGYNQHYYTLDLAPLKPLLARDSSDFSDKDRKAVVRGAKLILALRHPRTQPRAKNRQPVNTILREYAATAAVSNAKLRAQQVARAQFLDLGRHWRAGLIDSAAQHDVFAIYEGLKSPHAEALTRADRVELVMVIREKLLETSGAEEAEALDGPLAAFVFEGKPDEAVAAITALNARDFATQPVMVEEVKFACDEAVSRYCAYTDTHFRGEIRSLLAELEEKLSGPELKLQKVLVSQALKKLGTVERSARSKLMATLPVEALFSTKAAQAEGVHDVTGQGIPSHAFWSFVESESPELAALKTTLPAKLQKASSYNAAQLQEIAELQPGLSEQVRSMLET